ncbi:MAG: LysM peptidoglycan-binding domain-containing protein [Myxococcaceae bacterium]|nr:LysM peptidoglycan-binding domain-containing protein [Myxococcaceae bacterium]
MRSVATENSQSFRPFAAQSLQTLQMPQSAASSATAKPSSSRMSSDAFDAGAARFASPAASSFQGRGAGTTYVVQPGDTLFRIAQRFGTSVQAIAQANGISNPNWISVGQRLTIPTSQPQPPAPAPVPPPAPAPAPSPGSQTTYTVQPGDTLSAIARRFGTSVQAIAQANGITNPDRISIGQRLTIPGGGAPAPQPGPGPSPSPSPVVVGDPASYFMSQVVHPQYNPNGPWSSNNCGPASLAMALRAFGVSANGATVQHPGDIEGFIDETRFLMQGHRNDGALTHPDDIYRGAAAAGMNTQMSSGIDGVDQALAEGKLVVSLGNPSGYHARVGSDNAYYYNGLHFITVTGKRGDNYIINDPLSKIGPLEISRQELMNYLSPVWSGVAGRSIDSVAVWPR